MLYLTLQHNKHFFLLILDVPPSALVWLTLSLNFIFIFSNIFIGDGQLKMLC